MSAQFDAWIDPKDLAQFAQMKGKVRVAAAVALTKTAKDAQPALKAEAGTIFHLRNAWVPQGIRIKPANAATLTAQVGSIDKYMGRHVSGDPKEPAAALSIHGHNGQHGRLATGGLLIGLYAGTGDLHRTVRRRLGRIDGQKAKTFQIIAHGGKVMIVRRVGKGAKGKAGRVRGGLELLAVLSNTVKEQARWNMKATVSTVVGAKFPAHFEAAIEVGKSRG